MTPANILATLVSTMSRHFKECMSWLGRGHVFAKKGIQIHMYTVRLVVTDDNKCNRSRTLYLYSSYARHQSVIPLISQSSLGRWKAGWPFWG